MSEIAELLERYRRGAELVASSMTGAAGQEVDYKTAPDQWSVRQIVCHLADSEMVVAVRLRLVIAEQNPVLQAWDQEAWAANLDYARRKPSHAIETFRRVRSENYELLKDLPEDAFARSGAHSELGPVTLKKLVEIYAQHAESHVAQLRAVRAAYKEFRKQSA